MVVEVDRIDQQSWNELYATFADASIYQSWAYEAMRSGERNLSHLVVKQNSEAFAALQARIVRMPLRAGGLAYVPWGPLWRLKGAPEHLDHLHKVLRALREEYMERRGLWVRIAPRLTGAASRTVDAILQSEGYSSQGATRDATIIVDLRPSLDDLYRGLHHKWRYHLNKARKAKLELVEGEDERLFLRFERIYDEMVARKKFLSFANVTDLKKVQQRLPPAQRMRVFLLQSDDEICAGGICSNLGDTALYLFGATSNRGLRTYGSYLVHWRMLEWAKSEGCLAYDLNGIDPVRNAAGHQFKRQLGATHGQEVSFWGHYDAYPSATTKWLAVAGDSVRGAIRTGRQTFARFFVRSGASMRSASDVSPENDGGLK